MRDVAHRGTGSSIFDFNGAVRLVEAAAEPASVVDALEGIPFEEGLAFVPHAISDRPDEAERFLRRVAVARHRAPERSVGEFFGGNGEPLSTPEGTLCSSEAT
ncbi:MAG TPA: hypothetical protein VIK91_05885 [Nannocystis sp.]